MVKKEVSKKIKEEERLFEEIQKRKEAHTRINVRKHIKHFRFKDFAQITIGAGLFGLPAVLTPDLWTFIIDVKLLNLFILHVFFFMCTVIALNYEYRDDIKFDDKIYVMNLGKRIFFTWVTVMMGSIFMLALLGMMNFDFTVEHVLKNFFAVQSIGLIGGVTFSFFKKED
jgi:uncharacterized membrane protein